MSNYFSQYNRENGCPKNIDFAKGLNFIFIKLSLLTLWPKHINQLEVVGPLGKWSLHYEYKLTSNQYKAKTTSTFRFCHSSRFSSYWRIAFFLLSGVLELPKIYIALVQKA